MRSGQPLGAPLPHASKVGVVAVSPDGRTQVTSNWWGEPALRFWEAGNLTTAVPVKSALGALAWSPDGNWLVTGDQTNPFAQQWDARTRQPTSVQFPHDRQVRSVVFSPDSKLLLTGSYDETARLWDAVTGAPLSEPFHNPGEVGAVDLSRDGRWIVTGNDYRVACIWDTRTGMQVVAPCSITARCGQWPFTRRLTWC